MAGREEVVGWWNCGCVRCVCWEDMGYVGWQRGRCCLGNSAERVDGGDGNAVDAIVFWGTGNH